MWEERMTQDDLDLIADRFWNEFLEAGLPEKELSRVRGLLDIWAKRQAAEPAEHQGMQGRWFMPGLPGKAWMDRALFEPTASKFEALYPEIKREVLAEEAARRFRPYAYKADAKKDVRQSWVPPGWDELRLWEDFKPTLSILRMPVAAQVLDMFLQDGWHLNHVGFLAMRPGTYLPVHHDRTNWYVSVHMGIRVPHHCVLRVAKEERSWEEGKCMFFDNSFEHDAWNRGDARRIILGLYLSHPLTTPVEREALSILQTRIRQVATLGYEATIAWAKAGRRPQPPHMLMIDDDNNNNNNHENGGNGVTRRAILSP